MLLNEANGASIEIIKPFTALNDQINALNEPFASLEIRLVERKSAFALGEKNSEKNRRDRSLAGRYFLKRPEDRDKKNRNDEDDYC